MRDAGDVRGNNFGLLRLIFALLVIVGHAPELIDGDRSREPLTFLFGTLSLGELSVDAFFIISGYLITQSAINCRTTTEFLARRLGRIVPGFTLAYLVSVYGLGAIANAHPFDAGLSALIPLLGLHRPPIFPGQLPGLPYPELNGAMWTIAYEFRCYLLAALLAAAGALSRRRIIALAAGLSLVALAASGLPQPASYLHRLGDNPGVFGLIEQPWNTLRFTAAFLVGMSFYLYRRELLPLLSGSRAALCAAGAAAFMSNKLLAEPLLMLLGGTALLWLALRANLGRLRHINARFDISYGTYLYGWPIATAATWLYRGISPELLVLAVLPLAMTCGAISWVAVERPVQRRLQSFFGRGSGRPPILVDATICVAAAGPAASPGQGGQCS